MTTSAQVAAYEHEARAIPGLPDNIVYLPDNPLVLSGLQAKMGDGNAPYLDPATGYIEGAPNYTVTRRIALHELGHLRDFNNRGQRDAFWTARFGACTTAPKTWAEAYADAHTGGTEIWMVLPGETIAECFAVAVEGSGKERTLDYGCTVDPAALRAFFGLVTPAPAPHAIEWQGPVPITNYYQGRDGNPISLIVDHWMAGSFDSALARFMSPAAQVSAHYLISQQGRIVQVVRDEDTAYHAGDFPVNQRAIGIEHEASPTQFPSDAVYAASAWLHHKLSLDYGLRLVVGETVKPHRAIVATQCPGTLDLDRIVLEAGGGADMTEDEVIAIIEKKYGLTNTIAAMKAAYDPLVPLAHPKTHEHILEGKAK